MATVMNFLRTRGQPTSEPESALDLAPRTSDVPDLPTLLGLRSGLVMITIGILAVGYAFAFAPGSVAAATWGGQVLALLLALAAITTSILIPTDPLPRWAALILSAAALVALALGWWHMTDDDYWWVQVTVPPAMTAVFAGFLALRGRAGLSWLVLLGAMGIAAAWAVVHRESVDLMFAMTSRVVGAVLPATIIAAMIRPMMTLLGALRTRELDAVELAAAAEATSAERADRLAELQRDVRPLLQRIAAGETFTADEARHIQILENSLRDEVRGQAWASEGVRQGVALARLRGVSVQLFDDGGLDIDRLSARDVERLRGEAIRVLTSAGSGLITARILPPGRDQVATISVSDDGGVDRRVCQQTPGGLQWSGGAPEMRNSASE
ncbi:MAG: hypothetical protein WAW85_13600 [Gordonia sp. (in: high G+C Gram-positive bacteria)]|uniref:hypothetical protein n=1 Tax=Gordonia sp. (in: high G+C Gram-positive bacteria) TaxID=84139 RepID=UPI003BB70DB8